MWKNAFAQRLDKWLSGQYLFRTGRLAASKNYIFKEEYKKLPTMFWQDVLWFG